MNSVMGYSAVSMKGKTITVEAVEGVATPHLGKLLGDAEAARQVLVRPDDHRFMANQHDKTNPE